MNEDEPEVRERSARRVERERDREKKNHNKKKSPLSCKRGKRKKQNKRTARTRTGEWEKEKIRSYQNGERESLSLTKPQQKSMLPPFFAFERNINKSKNPLTIKSNKFFLFFFLSSFYFPYTNIYIYFTILIINNGPT